MFPTEERPEGMSEHSWNGILFTHHAEGCPELAKVIARGIELAEKHGWT
jgi:hypothetical protein